MKKQLYAAKGFMSGRTLLDGLFATMRTDFSRLSNMSCEEIVKKAQDENSDAQARVIAHAQELTVQDSCPDCGAGVHTGETGNIVCASPARHQ
jgi:hypothetical protein